MPRSMLSVHPDRWVEWALERGQPAFRGRQIAHALFQRRVPDILGATDLPLALREELAGTFDPLSLPVVESERGEDGTTKYLFELGDGARIEAVALPRETGRTTFCLSSQVGCRMACVFCATGRMGIVRQLEAGEIVAQVFELARRHTPSTHPNLVFMGMGEPFDNLEGLLPALDLICDPEGYGLSARRVTVSTSGLLPGIDALARRGRPVGLAISLTTAIGDERARLMPVAGQVPLDDLLGRAADYARRVRRKVTLECAIIAGVNDGEEHARALLAAARRGPFKVNLIPLNPVDGYAGRRPEASRLAGITDLLWASGVVCTVRDSQGRDVEAACGQLVRRQPRRAGAPTGRAVARPDRLNGGA